MTTPAFKAAIQALEACSETAPSLKPLVRKLKKEAKIPDTFYVIHVEGGVEPEIVGPFKTTKARDTLARKLRKVGEEDAIFWLNIGPSGKPEVGAYSNGFMEGIKGFNR